MSTKRNPQLEIQWNLINKFLLDATHIVRWCKALGTGVLEPIGLPDGLPHTGLKFSWVLASVTASKLENIVGILSRGHKYFIASGYVILRSPRPPPKKKC